MTQLEFKPAVCDVCQKAHQPRIAIRKPSSNWKPVCSGRCLSRHPWIKSPNVKVKGLTKFEEQKLIDLMNAVTIDANWEE